MILPSSAQTPYYLYDLALLRRTAQAALAAAETCNAEIHYALKANSNERIVRLLGSMGMGADCVSGAEVQRALDCGIAPSRIAFAGVGKRDDEIALGVDAGIFAFNCESEQELDVIDEIAAQKGRIASVALRVNPNVDAHTHAHITTGLEENKFGINLWQLNEVAQKAARLPHLKLVSLHFHIGSQITDMEPFVALCKKINELQTQLEKIGIRVQHINVGGGLGVDYEQPDAHPIPDFESYFGSIGQSLELRPGQQLHCELGRSVVAQCGSLITRCLYVKELQKKRFAIVDAGFTDLIRPALYGAHHKIENLSAAQDAERKLYDVVGPICESSDVFAKDVELPDTHRGDLFALRTAGAYGEVMASQYNLRELPGRQFEDLKS
jgi:diaminopimelate decarboxylase